MIINVSTIFLQSCFGFQLYDIKQALKFKCSEYKKHMMKREERCE